MALPTTNLTFHATAHVNTDTWVNYQAGTPYHNTTGADGNKIDVWDDADGKTISLIAGGATGPIYRVATPLMPLPCLDFNGSSEFLVLLNETGIGVIASSAILGAGAKTIIISFYVEAVTTNQANAEENEGLFTDTGESLSGGYYGLYLKNTGSGYKLIAYNWDGNSDTIELDVALNTAYVATMRHDGTNLYFSLNGGSESSVASGNTTVLTAAPALGRNYSGYGNFFNGRIGEVATYNTALTGTDLTDANSWFTGRWLAAPHWTPIRTYRPRPFAPGIAR